DHRVAIGLNALISDVPLSDVARAHSRHMIVHDFFGHTNPEGDYITERMVKYGMHGTLWGENICVGAYTPLHAFNTLLASPGHKYVMELPDWRYIGVGYWEDTYDSGTYIYRQYWTQNFSNY
nr:CAP domain-containing protein [Desulfobacterales bacterium]